MSKKIYVGNLPFSVGFKELTSLFEKFGEIQEAVVISDKFSGKSKGFGFVTFADDKAADKAVKEMDGKDAEGRALKVKEATPREETDRTERRPPRRDFGRR
jgi:RNA recognition motif-containing protein